MFNCNDMQFCFWNLFANEKKDGEMTVNSVMAELNTEFSKEIEKKRKDNTLTQIMTLNMQEQIGEM